MSILSGAIGTMKKKGAIAGTVLLLNGDGTDSSTIIIDSSPYNSSIARNGHVQIKTAIKKYGTGSIYFDGAGDYLTVPNSTELQLGNSDFTIECWVNLSALGNQPWVNKWSGNFGEFYFGLLNSLPTFVLTSTGITSGGYSAMLQSNGFTATTNVWYHYAVVREGSSLLLFINGVLNNSTTVSGSVYTGLTPVRVGTNLDVPWYFTGYLDDLRIIKGKALYTTNFTPPTDTLTSVF